MKSKIQDPKSKENPNGKSHKSENRVRKPGRRSVFLLLTFGFCLSFGFWISSFSARADTPTTLPKPPEGAYDVYEWVIFIADPSQPQLNTNAASLYDSTLPDFVGGRRNPAPSEKAADPTPLGVIRFSGSSGSDKVDILVTNKGGKFLAHWPKATNRQTGVLWQNFVITDTAPASQEPVGGSTWFEQLRSPAGPFVLKDGRGERFLAYDLEPSHKLDLKVSPGSSPLQYSVSHNTKLPLLNLTFYKPADDGWHTATVASLQPTNPPKASTKPAATKAAAADGAPNTNNGQTTVTARRRRLPSKKHPLGIPRQPLRQPRPLPDRRPHRRPARRPRRLPPVPPAP